MQRVIWHTYSYVKEEFLGSSKKIVQNYLLFLCITNQICALQEHGLEEPF